MTYLALARAAVTECAKSERSEKSPVAGPADALIPQLEKGWAWLHANPNHPEHDQFMIRWVAKLREYEMAYANQTKAGDNGS
jgi:hypothetical protein